MKRGMKHPKVKFNEKDEFIEVAQRLYSEYIEIYFCQPCILDEDRTGHNSETCDKCGTSQETFCRGVNEDIPL